VKLEDLHAKINRGRDRNAFNGAGEMNQGELTELIRGGESETTEFNLVSMGLFKQVGVTGKGTEYILGRRKGAKDAIKTP